MNAMARPPVDVADVVSAMGRAAHNRAYAVTISGRPREGKPFDFANRHWRMGGTGLPLVADASAVFECDTHESLDADTHRIYIGRVVATHQGEAEPLVYCNRAFRRITCHEGV